MKVDDKLALLDELRRNKDKYLPVIDHAWKVFSQRNEEDLNIGWDVGIIGENRPYFCEPWKKQAMIPMISMMISD